MMQVDEVTQKLTAATQEKDEALKSLDRARKMPDESAKKFGKDLAALVTATGAAADDPAKTIDASRALLAARDQIRASLDTVAGRSIALCVGDKVGIGKGQAVVRKAKLVLLPADHAVAVVVQDQHGDVQLQADGGFHFIYVLAACPTASGKFHFNISWVSG